MRVVVCGDSIAFGEHVPTSERWTTRMAEAHPEWNVLTRAVCGDTTRLALERFPQDVQAAHPDCVVLSFGHNDAQVWEQDNGLPRVSLRAFAANMLEMIARSRAAGALRIVLCTPHRTTYPPEYETRLAAYAAAIRQIDGVALCDLHHRAEVELLDGLHPSAKGHEMIAGLVGEVIAR